jgi:hypothetical protein
MMACSTIPLGALGPKTPIYIKARKNSFPNSAMSLIVASSVSELKSPEAGMQSVGEGIAYISYKVR